MPLLTVNGWILMQRKVTGGSLSFYQYWAEYRDGFGASTGNDNYWLGLDKIYRLVQMGSTRLRVEVIDNKLCRVQGWICDDAYHCFTFAIPLSNLSLF